MSSLYIFLPRVFSPLPDKTFIFFTVPAPLKMTFHLQNGKTFTVLASNASAKNIYIQSAALNGKPLDKPWIRHKDITEGGVLEFTMGPAPSAWGCNGEFDPLLALRELAPEN